MRVPAGEEARARLAAAIRAIGHAVVEHEVPDDLLERLAATASRLADGVEAAPVRERSAEDIRRLVLVPPPDQDGPLDHFPDCVVSGAVNPLGMELSVAKRGAETVAEVTLGAAFEGAPGRAHGGVVAALFDDAMGSMLPVLGLVAFTGWLRVDFRAPFPVGERVTLVSRLRSRERRKLMLESEAMAGDRLVATAEALFISIDPGRIRELVD